MTLRVIHVSRRPQAVFNFSVETLFRSVREHLPPDVVAEEAVAPWQSRGIARRIGNTWWAARWRHQVAHVTGDILYVAPVLGQRSVITVLDLGWLSRGAFGQAVYETLWFRWPTRAARVVTTISSYTRDALVAQIGCPPGRVHVVPACVDAAYTPVPVRFRGESPVILAVGTTANKNIERLCAAIAGLDCVLHVVGRLDEALYESIRRHGIRLRSSVGLSRAEIVEAYRDADIVAFPSLFEGFGLPIVEGQATGRPVLTSTVTAMPEVAGNAACLVDPLDVASIRRGILRIIESAEYRAELRERGFENVRRFSPVSVAQQYADLYRTVAQAT
jgi:glycosyltransferase involved in cell wall biosynthesis